MEKPCEVLALVCFALSFHGLNSQQGWTYGGDRIHFHLHEHAHDHSSEKELPEPAQEIPLDLVMQLGSADNVDDFINNFVDIKSIRNDTSDKDIVGNRFGGDERKAVTVPKQAACIPELQVVSVKESDDPTLYYYPSCIRVERCGGCCGSALVSCQPAETEVVNHQILVTEYRGGKQMQFKGKEIVPVVRHTKCTCDCTVKEKDCNKYQEYRKNECRCVCLNVDDQKKCLQDNETKLWDAKTCSCECREPKECTTGFYFDQSTCSCTQIPHNRNRSTLGTRRRRGEAPCRTNQQEMIPFQAKVHCR